MKNISLLFLAALSVAYFGACTSNSGLKDIVENKFYIVKDGLQRCDVFDIGENFNYDIGIYKSGTHNSGHHLSFICNQIMINDYNLQHGTNYKLLPDKYYSLDQETKVEKHQTSISVPVQFNVQLIAQELGYTSEYVLPLEMICSDANVVKDKSVLIIQPFVKKPIIRFFTDSILDYWGSHFDQVTLIPQKINIGGSFPNKDDIQIELEYDVSLIEEYNIREDDNIEIMPVEALQIPDLHQCLTAGNNNLELELKIDFNKLQNWHSYAIPLSIKNVSKYQVDKENKNVLLIYRVDNLQGWYTVEERDGNTRDWSVKNPNYPTYPFRRYLKRIDKRTYETGYGSRIYFNLEYVVPTEQAHNNYNKIWRDLKTNKIIVQQGNYINRLNDSYYDANYNELTIHYNYSAWPDEWTHEKMINRANSK